MVTLRRSLARTNDNKIHCKVLLGVIIGSGIGHDEVEATNAACESLFFKLQYPDNDLASRVLTSIRKGRVSNTNPAEVLHSISNQANFYVKYVEVDSRRYWDVGRVSFAVSLTVDTKTFIGMANSKRDAKSNAARQALEYLEQHWNSEIAFLGSRTDSISIV